MKKINEKIKYFVKVNPFNTVIYGLVAAGFALNINNIASRGKIDFEDIIALGALGFATFVNTGNARYRIKNYNSVKETIEKEGFSSLDFRDKYIGRFARIYAQESGRAEKFNTALIDYKNKYKHAGIKCPVRVKEIYSSLMN